MTAGPPSPAGSGWNRTSTKISSGNSSGRVTCIATPWPVERLGGIGDAVEQVDKGLAGEFRHGLGHCLAGEVVMPDQLAKGAVGDSEAMIGAFEQRHESGRPLEHLLEPLAFALIDGKLVQHRIVLQQRRAAVTALLEDRRVAAHVCFGWNADIWRMSGLDPPRTPSPQPPTPKIHGNVR